MESPEFLRISLAAAITLDLEPGLFYRDAKLYCINLLVTYEEGCRASCSYCGLSKIRPGDYKGKSFIRVKWPLVRTEEVVERMRAKQNGIKRACISMITRRRSVDDTIGIAQLIRSKTDIPISLLISPTVVREEDFPRFLDAGVDKVGIAIDAATADLFERHRGRGVRGPHRWDRYWRCLDEALKHMGEGNAGSHFIVGLGETEREMVHAIQEVKDRGGCTHLFSFFPEHGSLLQKLSPPPIPTYRRIQLARYLIDNGVSRADAMEFDEVGRIRWFGLEVKDHVESGRPFMTSGCTGRDGEVACNRPFANERPSQEIRNYPFPPEEEDISGIKAEIWDYTTP